MLVPCISFALNSRSIRASKHSPDDVHFQERGSLVKIKALNCGQRAHRIDTEKQLENMHIASYASKPTAMLVIGLDGTG